MKKFTLFTLVVCACSALISWGVVGHKTVAAIAENHLTIKAKTAVKTFLGDEELTDVASWADEVLRQPEYKHTAPWHYLNVPLGLSYADFKKVVESQDKDNVYNALNKSLHVLSENTNSNDKRAEALKFIVHLVGDLHQPMHVSRAEDKGGNTIQVQFEGKGTNLHSLWDNKLIGKEGKNFAEMAIDYDKATPEQIKQWQGDPIIKWLWESYQISSKLYSEIEKDNKLDDSYYKARIGIVNERIEMAGIRLAGLLNNVFSSEQYKAPTAVEMENAPVPKSIAMEDATKHIGERVSIKGIVKSEKRFNGMLLLNMGADYPNQLLTIVLKGDALITYDKWKVPNVEVRGKLILYRGKPEIVISNIHDLSLKDTVE